MCHNKGIPVYGEVQFCLKRCQPKVIAITGTNGKTTTASLLHHILLCSGVNSYLLGNIGSPVSTVLRTLLPSDIVVLELSSFQLERYDDFNPYISALLNVKQDHIDRHGSIEEYIRCKCNVFAHQSSNNHAIFNYDDTVVRELSNICLAQVHYYGLTCDKGTQYSTIDNCINYYDSNNSLQTVQLHRQEYKHNVSNIACCITASSIMGIEPSIVEQAVSSFVYPPHRLSRVATVNGVDFVNDSKSTNCASTISAIENFATYCLILGGSDKNEDYTQLRNQLDKCVFVACYGQTGSAIRDALRNIGCDVMLYDCLCDAVYACYEQACNYPCPVLFSPACASFDHYTDYAHRGECFVHIVQSIADKVQKN